MNTGEFAKLCGVEKRTLFHYDALGLLQPFCIHENGYRDYDPSQVEQMDMIKLLQASGYSLKEISEILAQTAKEKRESFFSAAKLMDEKIAEMTAMRQYIRKKEQLYRQYQEWKAAERPCFVQSMRMAYVQKPIEGNAHYFCFLNDGDYDGIMIDGNHQMFLCRDSEEGFVKEGDAAVFFLEAANTISDMAGTIKDQLNSSGFQGDGQFFLHPIPHLLLEEPQQGIVRVAVFEQR